MFSQKRMFNSVKFKTRCDKNYFFSKKNPKRLGNTHPNIAPYDLFQTKTLGIYIACGNDRQFHMLCKVLGYQGSVKEFATNELRVRNRKLLENRIGPLILKKNAKILARKLLKSGVPAGPALELKDALQSSQVKALKIVQRVGQKSFVMPPYQFSRSKKFAPLAAPKLGAQTRKVLEELGLTAEAMKNILSQQKVGGKKK